MPSSLQVISVFTWLMLQHQTSWGFIMTKENGLEPSDWDSGACIWLSVFSSRKNPAKFAHSRQVKKAMLSSQILALQFLLTKQGLEHKEQTPTKPQSEIAEDTKEGDAKGKAPVCDTPIATCRGEKSRIDVWGQKHFFLNAISRPWSFFLKDQREQFG